jgi:OOP family OmpA-OmpF porin
MRLHGFAAVLLGSMILAPIPAAMGQTANIAYAVDPRPEYVVFLDRGTNQLSSAASDTVRIAARAAKSAHVIRLVGRPDQAQVVKNELIRDGVPAGSIVVVDRASYKPFPAAAGGIAEPVNRRVEILF